MPDITPPIEVRQGPDGAPYWPGPGHEAAADVFDRVGEALLAQAVSPFRAPGSVVLDPEKVKALRGVVLDALTQAVMDGQVARINSVEVGIGDQPGQVVVVLSIWMPPPNDLSVAEIAIPMLFR